MNDNEESDDESELTEKKNSGRVIEVGWMTAVKDWAGVMISAQTLIGRILVSIEVSCDWCKVKIYCLPNVG